MSLDPVRWLLYRVSGCVNLCLGALLNMAHEVTPSTLTSVFALDSSRALEAMELREIVAAAEHHDGVLRFMGQSRDLSIEGFEKVKAAIALLDISADDAGGVWMSKALGWSTVQRSAASTLLMPTTIYQGGTTTCGATTVLEAMATHRPHVYARLVLACYRGAIVMHDGTPWGERPALNPKLLEQAPAKSVSSSSWRRSNADWMVAVAVIAELKEQSAVFDRAHADYLGQDAIGPDGKATVDFKRGLTAPWDVARMMRELLGCSSVHRELSYWSSSERALRRLLELTASGSLARGEVVCVMTIWDRLWSSSAARWAHDSEQSQQAVVDASVWRLGLPRPDHMVRVHSIEPVADLDDRYDIRVFSMGEVQQRRLCTVAFSRVCFECIFGTLDFAGGQPAPAPMHMV